MELTSVILAAGQGTRMHSATPKVLHPLLGRPMIQYCLDTAVEVTGKKPVLVVGYQADQVRQAANQAADFVMQEQQLGTGHALRQAESLLSGKADYILVTFADMPLLKSETLERVVHAHLERQAHSTTPITMLTIMCCESRGFGRVIRDAHGRVQSIVEEAEATPEQLAIQELNPSVYCFNADWLWEALKRVDLSSKGEYYLTDVVAIAVADGFSVQAVVHDDDSETLGINTRIHLAEAEMTLRQRTNQKWMLAGVTLIDPTRTYIETTVEIGQDTVIWPDTYLRGNSRIGEASILGPNTILQDSQVGDRCEILESVLEKALLEDDVHMGPYCHLRKGAHLSKGVHMGNFGEVKNSHLGPGVKMGHFSYVGDATIGPGVNVSAGVITCNFDGQNKHHTEIGANAFIGSDTMLIAPVTIGEGARTGAGAVVTKDIPSKSLAVGVPARVIRKLNSHTH
jgi:bifunctional UDP-N-acetylglucosamine pyrophosphorylase/glucosamine-1-phosphate N-acetyltransferase